MTITEIIDKLRQERELGSRFPARIIFCEDLSYSALVKQLKSACDVTINLADFGKKDVVPRFEKIRDAITQYDDKQVLLLSVGEYLRICIKRELNKERAQFPSFWEAMQQEASRTRIIMPSSTQSLYIHLSLQKQSVPMRMILNLGSEIGMAFFAGMYLALSLQISTSIQRLHLALSS